MPQIIEWTRVLLTLLTGTVSAFVAFEAVTEVKHSQHKGSWLGFAGLTLGSGVWSTHFVGMMGWHTPFPLFYDLRFIVLSIAVAVVASCLSLHLSSQGSIGSELTRLAAAALFSAGTTGVHLAGMASLHLEPQLRWDIPSMALSGLVETALAYVGIRLLVVGHHRSSGLLLRLTGATALGAAITGVHFAAMRAISTPVPVRSLEVLHAVDGAVLARMSLCNVLLFGFGLLVLSSRQSRRWMQLAHEAQHSAREASRQAERLATAGKLAASIAHEINNPLEAVVNLLYLIDTGPISDESRTYLKQAQSEIGRISAITTHTLKFYRQQSAPEVINIADLFDTALVLFEPRLQRAGIVVKQSWARLQQPIRCNAGEMRQVFANLVSNAIDAMPQGGTLTISTQALDEAVEIVVSDTGVGMPPEVQRQVLEPFFTTKGAAGTGLGLSICAEIIARHKGKLTFQSRTEAGSSGTTFSIQMPLQCSDIQTTFAPAYQAVANYGNAQALRPQPTN